MLDVIHDVVWWVGYVVIVMSGVLAVSVVVEKIGGLVSRLFRRKG